MVLASRRCTYMVTKAGVGMSYHHNPNVAGREAAEQALQKAGLSKPDFVFVFGSIGYDQHSLVRAVRETTRGAPLTGCSAEGTIDGDDADESNFSVVVTAISSEELRWHNGLASGLRAETRRRSPPGSIGWLGRSRSNLGVRSPDACSSSSV